MSYKTTQLRKREDVYPIFRRSAINSNKIILALLLLFILWIEVGLGKRVISSPTPLLLFTSACLIGFLCLLSPTKASIYIITFTPIVIVPLFKIKFAEVYPLDVLLPLLLIVYILNTSLRKEVKLLPSPLYAPMIAFIAIAILSLVNSYIFWDISVPTTHRFLISQIGDVTLKSLPFIAFIIAFHQINSRKWIKFLYLSITCLGLVGIIPFFVGLELPRFLQISTIFLAFVFSLALSRLLHPDPKITPRERFGLSLIVVACSYIILSQTHLASIVTFVMAALFAFYIRSRRIFFVAVLVLLIFSLFAFNFWLYAYNLAAEEGSLARIPMAMAGLQIFKNHWLLGVGPANYYSYAIAHQVGWQFWRAPMPDIHNNYLTILIEMGSLGLLALLWLILRSFKGIFSAYHSTQDSFQKAFIAGAGASFAGIVATSVAGGYLMPGVHSGAFAFFSQTAYAWILLGAALAIPRLSESEIE